jgi:hypothetical protein
MNFKPRPMSIEGSIGWIVISTFWIVFVAWGNISNLRNQGLPLGWRTIAEMVFWILMFVFSVWSGIKSGKMNRQERIGQETDLGSGKNG